jgi:hypothetical protein
MSLVTDDLDKEPLCYKTFYGCNLQFLISQSGPFQAF